MDPEKKEKKPAAIDPDLQRCLGARPRYGLGPACLQPGRVATRAGRPHPGLGRSAGTRVGRGGARTGRPEAGLGPGLAGRTALFFFLFQISVF